MGTLLPFIRHGRVILVTSASSEATYPRFAREAARPSLPLRPTLHGTETANDHPAR